MQGIDLYIVMGLMWIGGWMIGYGMGKNQR